MLSQLKLTKNTSQANIAHCMVELLLMCRNLNSYLGLTLNSELKGYNSVLAFIITLSKKN